MDEEKQLVCYTRDPHLLFAFPTPLHPQAQEKQPVTYSRVRLQMHVAMHFHGLQEIHEVRVNWHTGHLLGYLDAADAINAVPFINTQLQHLCVPQTADAYVAETLRFLRRGHSLLHPQCRCTHEVSAERATELGIMPQASAAAMCLVECKRTRRSLHEIALELGVKDLRGLLHVSPSVYLPLLDILIQYGGMQLTNAAGYVLHLHQNGDEPLFLHCPSCCVPHKIASQRDLVLAAQVMYPHPFVLESRALNALHYYHGIQDDLVRLQTSKQVRAVGSDSCTAVFWCHPTMEKMQCAVDSDIQALWAAPVASSSSIYNQIYLLGDGENPFYRSSQARAAAIERELCALGLRPTLVQPPPPPPPIQKKAKRSVKKRKGKLYRPTKRT